MGHGRVPPELERYRIEYSSNAFILRCLALGRGWQWEQKRRDIRPAIIAF